MSGFDEGNAKVATFFGTEDSVVLLNVRVFGVFVTPSTIFKGRIAPISNMYSYATGGSAAKNERRKIRLSQSPPFKPKVEMPSVLLREIYESEVFENEKDVNPALIASVNCPEGHDCELFVELIYSSSKTSNKEVSLSEIKFSMLDMISKMKQGVFTVEMRSEHCPGTFMLINTSYALFMYYICIISCV